MRNWLCVCVLLIAAAGCVGDDNTTSGGAATDDASSGEASDAAQRDAQRDDAQGNNDTHVDDGRTEDTRVADVAAEDAPQMTPDVATADASPDLPPGNGCGRAPGDNDQVWSLEHDGLTRTFRVHLPSGYDPSAATPVVLNFHGRATSGDLQIALSKMPEVADAGGFIAVHPEGTGDLERVWNAGLCCGSGSSDDVDDVGFTAAMLDRLERDLCIDTRRVYATGMSNGAFMAHRLGCELSDRIAAVAPVSGTMTVLTCDPERAVPVFHFHGTDDNIVPYDGFAGFISVPSTIGDWVSRNGCDSASTVFFEEDDVRCELWSGCRNGAEVRLCTVEGGGHTWPGGLPAPFLGETTDTISASEMMWEFFQRHTL